MQPTKKYLRVYSTALTFGLALIFLKLAPLTLVNAASPVRQSSPTVLLSTMDQELLSDTETRATRLLGILKDSGTAIPTSLVVAETKADTEAQEATDASSGFQVMQLDSKLLINFGLKPVMTFVYRDEKIVRPHFANVRLLSGVQTTRNHPPDPAVDAVDHDTMHPGIWLGFGDINREDFWRNKGRIEHIRFSKNPEMKDDVVEFSEESRMLSASGQKMAELHSQYQLRRRTEGFLLTWDAELKASEVDLVFGDQEEMGLGARMATPLTEKAGGKITSSDGLSGASETWGKQAAWCDYSGKIDDRLVGITIFPSPRNAHASWWHNRDYGVFVANPFGKRAGHEGGKLTVKKGESLRLKFHVLFHEGTAMPDLAAIANELAK